MVKKIHYVWLGGEEPEVVKTNVERWSRLNPDFEICAWHHVDDSVLEIPFAKSALAEKRWAFLSDIVRLKAMAEYGGVYLDCDVELLSPLNRLEPYGGKLVMGYMYDCALGTAAWYAPPQHPYIADIIERYHHLKKGIWPVNNSIFTEYFINSVPGFLLNGKSWENEQCKLFPKEYFEQPAFMPQWGVSVHHCCGSWRLSSNMDAMAKDTRTLPAHLLLWLKRKIRTYRSLRSNEFRACYKAACRNQRLMYPRHRYYDEES